MADSKSQIGAARRRHQQKGEGPPSGIAPAEVPSPKEAAEDIAAKLGPKYDAVGMDDLPADFEFDLNFSDTRGYLWTGHFKAHVLTINEKARVGLTKTRLAGGMNPVLLDIQTQNILEMQAHLAVALDASPPWCKQLHNVRDGGVLAAIYDEVALYEQRFWGSSAGDGSAGDSAPPDESP